jgi:hypothetical protein
MTKYLVGLIGLALLSGSALLGQAATCGGECGCGCSESGCSGCNSCEKCCPHCGCRLVPVCHTWCEPKKVTKHEYSCVCEEVCIPKPTCCCNKCCEACGEGACGCNACNNGCSNGCDEGCGCKCRVRDINKLVIHPCTKEVPVRKCSVEWVCPNCGKNCQSGSCVAPSAPAAPSQGTPAPAPKVPMPPKTTDVAPLPPVIGALQAPLRD